MKLDSNHWTRSTEHRGNKSYSVEVRQETAEKVISGIWTAGCGKTTGGNWGGSFDIELWTGPYEWVQNKIATLRDLDTAAENIYSLEIFARPGAPSSKLFIYALR